MADDILKSIMTPEKIHHDIEKMLSNGVSYIEALVEYSKRNDLEIESLGEVVKKSSIIKEKIREEALKKRLMKINKDESQLCY